ncbi:hypothetical protein [Pseudomonas sp. SID14000]|uniref:hypothetical protein n=1 Tax=Pseudomonas sp. SID14000 TaxID=1986221 RepID=UPI002114DEC5|nr:hypothetical protein [Pseudomonas sp. SID14000]
MIGFDARWFGLPLMVAMFIVIFIWVYVSILYVNRIESLLSNSPMVSGNRKTFGHAGLLGKVMRTGSVSVMLSMRNICIRRGLLDLQDVKRFPGGLRRMLVSLWFVHVVIFFALIGLWGWLKLVGY